MNFQVPQTVTTMCHSDTAANLKGLLARPRAKSILGPGHCQCRGGASLPSHQRLPWPLLAAATVPVLSSLRREADPHSTWAGSRPQAPPGGPPGAAGTWDSESEPEPGTMPTASAQVAIFKKFTEQRHSA